VATSANFHARLQEAGCRVLPTIRATRTGEFLTRYWQWSIRTAVDLNTDSWVSAILDATQL
jgi:hypothetical protein